MTKSIIISLPIKDLARSRAFYTALGATFDASCSDESASLMVFSDAIRVMLLTHEKWSTFTKKQIPDAHKSSEFAMSISCESRAAVDDMLAAVKAAGGQIDTNPVEDHGFMYGRDFEDLDGHAFGAIWMDSTAT